MAEGTVAVVGAGLAGLAATVELKRLGFRVELFERSRLLGGKATSFEVDGKEIDNGQHVFLACYAQWLDFVEQLGMRDELYLQPRFEVLLLRGGARPRRLRSLDLPAPAHLLPVLLRYPGLGPLSKLRLARALLDARAPTLPPRGGGNNSTFTAWLDRHQQSAATRRNFWEPFLVPALNAPLDEVSAESALFVISTAFLADSNNARIGYSQTPLARMAAAAAEHADQLHLRTVVNSVTTTDGHVSGVVTEDGRSRSFDAVVLAVPPPAVVRILGEPERFGIDGLDGIRTRAIIDVHLWYSELESRFDFAAVLGSPVQWVFRKGPGYLCCSLSAADRLLGATESELIDLCHSELASVLPELKDRRPLRGVATRDGEATFLASPGLQRPTAATSIPNLAIAGAWTDTGWPATMESAVRSGRAAARVLAAQEVRRAA